MTELWTFEMTEPVDVTGYQVEAIDGRIGKIDEATYDTGAGCVIVDTGPWIFGKKRMIPAGAITGIDLDNEVVQVNLTKDRIKDAPDYEETLRDSVEYRDRLTDHYRRL